MDKKELYERKYKVSELNPSPYFSKQFKYIVRKYIKQKHLKILDLGGGTGEYSILIQQLKYDVTLFDFSKQAIKRAKSKGVNSIIYGDFLSYDFKNKKYDVVFVKGFSLLNTDNKNLFLFVLERIKSIISMNGVIVYMGQTDLSGKWTNSGWYQLQRKELDIYFTDYLILPAFRYQLYFPLIFNRLLTKVLIKFKTLPRSMTLVGIIK